MIAMYIRVLGPELLEIARSRVTRDLTDEECRTYLHVDECPSD